MTTLPRWLWLTIKLRFGEILSGRTRNENNALKRRETLHLAATMESKTAEIEAARLCQWGYRESGPASMNYVLNEVDQVRAAQDEEWGGPEHDDKHSIREWSKYIGKQLTLADKAIIDSEKRTGEALTLELDHFESRMLKIAGLSIAAIQSSRRKRNAL